ncbi:MAG: outer membrane lipoprotein carrier protein LolA [Verrucomicrobia bacterium]|nr:outer membrane lipoprotein carrier protein LolA [Verrucomicrobiota bacterium]
MSRPGAPPCQRSGNGLGRGLALLWLFALAAPAQGAENAALLDEWFRAQAQIHNWTAEFTQTRHLKALAQPLVATGRVWYAAPNQFRWELGQPAQTIAVRQADQVLILYPRLRRAERYRLTDGSAGPWRDALTLLEAGFPRDRPELEARFFLHSLTVTGAVARLTLEPRSSAARRLLAQVRLEFSTAELALRATELQFADGSTLRNDFGPGRSNTLVDPALFGPELDPTFTVAEPLAR